ncbi:hypothetical protein K505DRAFT_321606 [Melanomma pulvis-pyrius CBS 109.77]|uniref:Uncharacterized protein n=1 Tax=Melanomma pulvis-pyrius CBS 109.77 TaxID=1314802 RepID=A0A6A6XQI5_9PLEO|nr:hypothetical protein K505DRAFT_321606 [Melanomma pulvis-pyrius CBS 109.77]
MPVPEKFEYKPAKIIQEFECEYPSVDASVARERRPLPFPEELNDLIAWTDAFVDRIASMTVAQEKKSFKQMNMLATEIERLRTVLDTTEVDLDKSRDDVKAANARTEGVETKLAILTAESEERAHTIKDLEDRAAKEAAEEKLLRQQVRDLSADLDSANKSKAELLNQLSKADKEAAKKHAKWEKENKHHTEDHNALKKEQERANAERKAKETAEKELTVVRASLRKTKTALDEKAATNTQLNSKLMGLRTDVSKANKSNAELQKSLTETTGKLTTSESSLKAAQKIVDTLGAEVVAAKESIHKIDQDLKDANVTIASFKEQVKELGIEKDAATAKFTQTQTELNQAKADIGGLKTDLDAAKSEALNLQAKIKELESELEIVIPGMMNATEEKEDAEKKLNAINVALEKANSDLADAKKEVEKEKATQSYALEAYKVANKRGVTPDGLKRIEEAEKKAGDLQASLIETEKKAENLQIRIAETEKKTEDLKTRLTEAEKRLIVPTIPGKNINILTVEYGAKSYTYPEHKAIYDKLYAYAEKGTEFTVNNSLFNPDPWEGYTKSCSITYQIAGQAAPIHLCSKEYKTLKFRLN